MDRLALPPPSPDGRNRPSVSDLGLSELLRKAKTAIEQAREQIQKTQKLIAESKENRQSETALGRGFMRR